MFRFANPYCLYLFLLLPLLLLLGVWVSWRKKKDFEKYGEFSLLKFLMPDYSAHRFFIKYGLVLLSFCFLILALSRPQFGSKLETQKREGVELMICLDVSNSMLCEDIAPSRMDKAKQILSRLFDALNNDKTGLVVFAGEAFTQLPITSDFISAKMFLNTINPGLVSQQGTAIGQALNQAIRSFTPEEKATKAILVITDGENHEDDAVQIAQEAKAKGISVSVIGVGNPKGSPIPMSEKDNTYRKDKEGNVVITKLNESMCQEIAQAGGGIYVRADNGSSALKAITKHISQLSKGDIESKVYSEYNEQYQVFLLIAILLLLIEFFVMEKKNSLFKNFKLFAPHTKGGGLGLLIGVLFFTSFSLQAQKAERSHIRKGNNLYNSFLKDTTQDGKEKLEKTEIEYRKALEVNQCSVQANFNLANTLYKQGKYDQAKKQYERVITDTKDKEIRANSFHNIGNIAMQSQQYDNAISAYREALRNNPKDNETRYNLALAQKLRNQQQNQSQNQQQQQQEEEKKEEQPQEQQPQNNQQQPPKPQENEEQMSKENAQQILDAFLQDEKDTQEKVRKLQMPPKRNVDKDW
ncbi:MAG TPA: BatB/BatC protein [Porphyromonadaceae bacterium]|nr:BatB/BatC protein [Porphyromonadaceae bacterium]